MTAEIINFAERRALAPIRIKRPHDDRADGFLLPGIIFGCVLFWIFVGVAAVHAWPYLSEGWL